MKKMLCSEGVLQNGVAALVPVGTSASRMVPVIALLVICSGPLARAANVTITPTFASNITSDPNAATIEAAINATIARVQADITAPFADNITITFQETTSGLGSSSTALFSVPYSTYRSALLANSTPSANDTTADATLPAGTSNPVNGTGNVNVETALARALNIASFSGSDGTISLNTSIMNLSRTGGQNSNFYDLQAVAGHEIDEVLGIGGPGTTLTQGGSTTGNIGVLDLYRYSAPGVRSFTTAAGADPYFSINGGTTNIVYFNQEGASDNSDMADWGNGTTGAQSGNLPAQLQDAYGTRGVDVDIGASELTALDVIGYNLAPTPEPSPVVLMFGGLLLGVGLVRRRVVVTVDG